jgi:uncharacterized protein YqfA (UPF0365 family)
MISLPPLLAQESSRLPFIIGVGVAAMFALVLLVLAVAYGKLWFQAYMSNARVSIFDLIGMSLRQVDASLIVRCKIMALQAGVGTDPRTGITTRKLEGHYLAGGNVPGVIKAIIAGHRADIDLDFERAAAIDLAGRDVLDAVKTSVNPKVIDCPNPKKSAKPFLSAIAKNGVELRVRARVTVRTNLEQLIGGATEDTVVARVGEGIITSIGSSKTHTDVMANPDWISRAVLERGLDAHTAFEIVSIDIADIDVGENIGARLQADQAEADTRVAQAKAEQRRAFAIAKEQEMKARVADNRAMVVRAEAEVPRAMAEAFRKGRLEAADVPDFVAGNGQTGMDPRQAVREAVAANSEYALDESDAEWKVTVPTGGDRKQVVEVRFGGTDDAGQEVVEYRSLCGDASEKTAMTFLKYNTRLHHGAFAVETIDDTDRIIVHAEHLASSMNPVTAQRAIEAIAQQADRVEQKLSGQDEF